MTDIELLNLARGPFFLYATIIFILGIIIRMLEILLLGRKKDLAEGRGSEVAGGLSTIITRSLPNTGRLRTATFNIITGYIFHVGFLITVFFYAPHVLVFQELTGFSWSSLPSPAIDAITVITIVTLLAILAHRIMDPVKRFLSTFSDYVVWFLTILPLITGYMAFHRIGMSPPALIAMHIFSVELLMVAFPFTKLMHTFTVFTSRWYNGAMAGYKGVRT